MDEVMKLIPLNQLPLTWKLLITCFLLTLSAGNVAAGVYTGKYVGISYDAMVQTYSERNEDNFPIPETGKTNEQGEMEIQLNEIPEIPHRVDLKLLLQDAHVHLFSHGVLSLLTGVLLIWTRLPEKWKLILIPLPFLGGTLDFAGMFLVKFVADVFAYLILFAGFLTGISFTIVFFIALYEMWFVRIKNI